MTVALWCILPVACVTSPVINLMETVANVYDVISDVNNSQHGTGIGTEKGLLAGRLRYDADNQNGWKNTKYLQLRVHLPRGAASVNTVPVKLQ